MFLAILLPIAVLLVLCRIFLHRGDSTREAILRAAVAFVSILVAITELLSIPHLIARTPLLAAWTVVLLALLFAAIATLKSPPTHIDQGGRQTFHLPQHLVFIDIALASFIAVVLAIVGAVAIVAPPNTADAMEYHLPRVLIWISNHTVRNFPTADYAQLIQAPAAEFIHLHTYLLFGSDRLFNLVEFFALIGCAIAASLIAGRFGANRTAQLLAALFVVTIPEAILESSGSMTTVVVALWIATACYFTLRAVKDQTSIDVVTAALACGLALFTKGTAFIFLPFVILGCVLFRPVPRRTWMLKRIPLLILIALIVNTGQFVRAYQVTGTPLGAPFPAGGPRLHFGNDRVTPTTIAASIIRHATLHMGTPSDKVNARIESLARRAIRLTGNHPDDPTAVWLDYPFSIGRPSRLETQAGNPIHFALLILTLLLLPFNLGSLESKHRSIIWYTCGIALAFTAFCAAIRWQPWGSRFHLPIFILLAAPFGLLADRILRARWLVTCLAVLLVLNALPYLLSNSIRSILHTKNFPTLSLPRAELYFGDQHMALAPDDLALARAINASSCSHVAIDAYIPTPDDQIQNSPPGFWIYPLLAQLNIDGHTRSVEYINVQNSTARFTPTARQAPPCAIVCLDCLSSHGIKSDATLGSTQTFGTSQLTLSNATNPPAATPQGSAPLPSSKP